MNVVCPQCQTAHDVSPEAAGKHARCSSCGNRFLVPAQLKPSLSLPSVAGSQPPDDRVANGLNALGAFVGFVAVVGLIGAGYLASQGNIPAAIGAGAGTVSLWIWWLSVSLTVRALLQIERNTRR